MIQGVRLYEKKITVNEINYESKFYVLHDFKNNTTPEKEIVEVSIHSTAY